MKYKYGTKCDIFMNCSKKAFTKTNYDCQTWNTEWSIDVKEQRWLTNVKYLRLSTTHFMHISILYIYICVQFQCEIFMNSSNNFMGI